MKKVGFIFALLLLASPALALDPYAPREERGQGRIVVFTPQPETDVITISGMGKNLTTKSGTTLSVPVGQYKISVKMQNYEYNHQVSVDSTETTFFEVPGYGNLKVNSVNPNDTVNVTNSKTGAVVATFPASQTKVLPRGNYDVKVDIPGMLSGVKKDVWVVTNTTRIVDVKEK